MSSSLFTIHTVPPNWTHEPTDFGPTKGDSVWIHCQAAGFPEPKISWKKSESKKSSTKSHNDWSVVDRTRVSDKMKRAKSVVYDEKVIEVTVY